MPKITIDLPLETNERLKEMAKADRRSLTNYIITILMSYTGTLTLPSTTPMFYPATQQLTTPPFIPVTQDQTANSPDQDYSVPTTIGGRKVKSIIFEKEKTLTPEEQKLQELKIQKQEASLLEKREQKWYESAKKVLNEYWNDEDCRRFAHDHIYRRLLLP